MEISYIFVAEVKFGQQSMLLYIIYTAQYMYQKSYFSQDMLHQPLILAPISTLPISIGDHHNLIQSNLKSFVIFLSV